MTAEWIDAAFTPPEQRNTGMSGYLAESDRLVEELTRADIAKAEAAVDMLVQKLVALPLQVSSRMLPKEAAIP